MWILHFLPDALLAFVVNAVLVVGIAGTLLTFVFLNLFLKWFPALSVHYRVLQIVSVVILVAGVYFKGGYSTEMLWREKVAELEVKVREAEEASKKANTVIQEKVVEKVRVVRERGATEIQYVDRIVKEKEEIIKYVERCPIPQELLDAHNRAAIMGGEKK